MWQYFEVVIFLVRLALDEVKKNEGGRSYAIAINSKAYSD